MLGETEAFRRCPRPTSAMAIPPWQNEQPWRRIRPLLHIAGILTLPPIPGRRTRNEYRLREPMDYAN